MITKAVLWDMDGTLIDTENLFKNSLENINKNYKINFEFHKNNSGCCLNSIYAKMEQKNNLPFSFEAWRSMIIEYVLDNISPEVFRKDIISILKTIKGLGLKQSIVTNAPAIFVNNVVEKLEIISFFDHIISREDVQNGKPAPDSYMLSLKKHRISSESAIAIEDSAVGVTAASKANLKTITVTCPRGFSQNYPGTTYSINDNKEILMNIK